MPATFNKLNKPAYLFLPHQRDMLSRLKTQLPPALVHHVTATPTESKINDSLVAKEQRSVQIDTSHLDVIRIRLSHERSRLATSSSDSERQLRATWVAGIERELAGELEFLGLPPDPPISNIDDDALLAELTSVAAALAVLPQSTNEFFVSETRCFEQVADPNSWVKVNATTLSGAKRLAVKRSSRVTFTARVAIRNATGEFETVASLNNSKAITRRRAMWFTHSLQG